MKSAGQANRLRNLRAEMKELKSRNRLYWSQSHHSELDRSDYFFRQERLQLIKQEVLGVPKAQLNRAEGDAVRLNSKLAFNRMAKQDELLLQTYQDELAKDPMSHATEASRSNLIAIRHTATQMYEETLSVALSTP
jgi:hypothetical protein